MVAALHLAQVRPFLHAALNEFDGIVVINVFHAVRNLFTWPSSHVPRLWPGGADNVAPPYVI